MRGLSIGLAALVSVARLASADWDEQLFYAKPNQVFTIRAPQPGAATDTVVGAPRLYRVRKGDTYLDLARYFGLGYNEIAEANPGLDPWVPPVGATILLPTEWVLPCCTYEGVVVNVPEMRLFYYRRSAEDPGAVTVQTYPVGLGRDDWQTPSGKFRVTGKTVDPQWNIPASIRQEHIRERGDHRTFIPGGAPDNPLGKYRLELSLPMYRIHGTDIPWGVGMQVSHGCVRLYPEDIERLFPLVSIGTTGEFSYQTVKAGRRGDAVFVELHEDIYSKTPARYRTAMTELERQGLTGGVDQGLLYSALEDTAGLPYRVTPDPSAPRLATPAEWNGDGATRPDRVQARDD